MLYYCLTQKKQQQVFKSICDFKFARHFDFQVFKFWKLEEKKNKSRILRPFLPLTPPPRSMTKRENQQKDIFTLLCGATKGFMRAFKGFIKPFEASQRSVKIKI